VVSLSLCHSPLPGRSAIKRRRFVPSRGDRCRARNPAWQTVYIEHRGGKPKRVPQTRRGESIASSTCRRNRSLGRDCVTVQGRRVRSLSGFHAQSRRRGGHDARRVHPRLRQSASLSPRQAILHMGFHHCGESVQEPAALPEESPGGRAAEAHSWRQGPGIDHRRRRSTAPRTGSAEQASVRLSSAAGPKVLQRFVLPGDRRDSRDPRGDSEDKDPSRKGNAKELVLEGRDDA